MKPRGQCNPSLWGRGETVRNIQVWQPRAGWGLGTVDMGKISELLINVVKVKQAKEADKLEPKGMEPGWDAHFSSHADVALSVERRSLSHSFGIYKAQDKPDRLSF